MQTAHPMYIGHSYQYMMQGSALINLSNSGDYVEVVIDCDQNVKDHSERLIKQLKKLEFQRDCYSSW